MLVGLAALIVLALCQPGTAAPNEAVPVTYRFVRSAEPLAVFVELEVRGEARGRTRLVIEPSWGPVAQTTECFTDVSCRGADGGPLNLEAESPTSWVVRHEPRETLTLRYRLVDGGAVDREKRYRPTIRPGRFELIGHVGLIRPAHLELEEARPVTLAWEGFAEAGWQAVCSFVRGTETTTFTRPLSDILRAIYFGGKITIEPREVPGGELIVATQGDWKFTAAQFADLAAAVVSAERAFFEDESDPYYLITLSPFDESGGMGGTGLTQSFTTFLSPEVDLLPGSRSQKGVRVLLAHELFHHWNGGDVRLGKDATLAYWFSEGFTDYFARALLHRSGLISEAERLESLNELLVELWMNPEREAPNERIQEAFWNVRDVQRLPYLRGHLLAWCLNHEIRRASKNERSLDDVMRAIWRDAGDGEPRIHTEWLLERFAAATSSEYRARLEAALLEGRLPELPKDLAGDGAALTWEERSTFELGFDLDRSREEGVVRGVRAGSLAEEAGLRDGLSLKGMSVHFGDVEREVKFVIEREGRQEEIRYWPRSRETRRIPRFVEVSGQR